MEEILQSLIKSYSENKNSDQPKQFKLYSNLSTTQPLQRQCDLRRRIENGFAFLNDCVLMSDGHGLQSHPIPNSTTTVQFPQPEIDNHAEPQFDSLLNSESEESSIPNYFPFEIYTSILALDALECDTSSPTMSALSPTVIQNLIEFILPETGVGTFSIFKAQSNKKNDKKNNLSRPNSAATSSGCSSRSEEFDMDATSLHLSDGCDDNQENEAITNLSIMTQSLPLDDCNTTALALSVLLREGILDIKPTASVTELLLSNVGDVHNLRPGVIRTFLGDGDVTDAVTCANVLYLYYILTEDVDTEGHDIVGSWSGMSQNFTENVTNTENFLLETLNKLLICDYSFNEVTITSTESCSYQLHPSPDALLYALSRCTEISNKAKNLFGEPLTLLLDKRVGSSVSPLRLAMRILSADCLGLLSQDGVWIRRKLEAECCKLAEIQDPGDGGWPEDVMFKIKIKQENDDSVSHQVHFGGRALSTIFAVRALQIFSESVKDAKLLPTESHKYYGY